MRVAISILLLTVVGCSKQEGPPVRFVVPDGYRGLVTITRDPRSGASVPLSNGEFVVTIPAGGKLSVSSFDFVLGKHVVAARYASGGLLPSGREPADVAFRIVTVTPDMQTAIYEVGTQKEEEDEFKKH